MRLETRLPAETPDMTPADEELIRRVAERIVASRMAVPAILFLESSRPLTFVGSQLLHFLEPMVGAFVPGEQLRRLARLMEDRGNIERLVRAIEARTGEKEPPA